MAKQVGCATVTIRKIESDERRPSILMAERLADALSVPDELRGRFLECARGELAAFRLPDPGIELSSWPSALPAPVSKLLGRDTDLATIERMLTADGARLVTLTGPPGVGKTRLGVEVAARVAATAGLVVHYVPLAGVDGADDVPSTIVSALDAGEDHEHAPLDRVVMALGTAPTLLVLDNFEHVLDAAVFISDLLAGAPDARCIVTSRHRLDLYGEWVHEVEPLPTDAASAGVALFEERARASARSSSPTTHPGHHVREWDEHRNQVAAIVEQLDGLPLAIELAAGSLRDRTIEELRADLVTGLAPLRSNQRDRDARQRTMEGAVEWSFGLLGERQQGVLLTCATFAGSWSFDGATELCGRDEVVVGVGGRRRELEESLDVLLSHNLVRTLRGASGRRYAMFEVVRQFAVTAMRETDEWSQLNDRHGRWFAGLAETAAQHLIADQDRVWLDRLADEHENGRRALRWAIERDDAVVAQRIVGGLAFYWHLRGFWSEGRDWVARARALGKRDDFAWCGAAMAEGLLAWAQGQPDLTVLDESVRVAEVAGDPNRLADCLGLRGLIGLSVGEDGRALLERSLGLYRAAERSGAEAVTLIRLGMADQASGDLTSAVEKFETALERYRAIGSGWGEATARCNLADVHLARDEPDGARALYADAYLRYSDIGADWYRACALAGLGNASAAGHDVESAAIFHGAADALLDSLGVPMHPSDAAMAARWKTFARGELGEERYARAANRGAALLDDPFELAVTIGEGTAGSDGHADEWLTSRGGEGAAGS